MKIKWSVSINVPTCNVVEEKGVVTERTLTLDSVNFHQVIDDLQRKYGTKYATIKIIIEPDVDNNTKDTLPANMYVNNLNLIEHIKSSK